VDGALEIEVAMIDGDGNPTIRGPGSKRDKLYVLQSAYKLITDDDTMWAK